MEISVNYNNQEEQQHLGISEANYVGDFKIRLTFSDGHVQLVDFKPFLHQASHPTIRKYLEESKFKEFKIQDGNLDWNDFELCFPIEDLYYNNLLKVDRNSLHKERK